jgi:hypothetical protein
MIPAPALADAGAANVEGDLGIHRRAPASPSSKTINLG